MCPYGRETQSMICFFFGFVLAQLSVCPQEKEGSAVSTHVKKELKSSRFSESGLMKHFFLFFYRSFRKYYGERLKEFDEYNLLKGIHRYLLQKEGPYGPAESLSLVF